MRRLLFCLMVTFAFVACQDSGPLAPGNPELAKGGNGKGGGKGGGGGGTAGDPAPLGAMMFSDVNLSVGKNQSCQTCHEPSQGFAGAVPGAATKGSAVEGSVTGQFGDRKPPSAAYSTVIPDFAFSGNNAVGGHFWDGRATGEVTGTAAGDQALGPFLNPVEQALPDEACVVWRVKSSPSYSDAQGHLYDQAWPNDPNIFSISFPANAAMEAWCTGGSAPAGYTSGADVQQAYYNMARSIAAFEATLNVFDSDFDNGPLTGTAAEGEKLFFSKGKCHQCHDNKSGAQIFSDFQFHNVGVPANPANVVAGGDLGLGFWTGRSSHLGKFKTPTVRNVDAGDANRTFMHNGALTDLEQVVQFYNTRDVLPTCDPNNLPSPDQWGPGRAGCWPSPEYPHNLDTKNMGNLGLTDYEVGAIVAFMEALTDQSLLPQ